MSNRVEELESQVAELQDVVDGLTEELVETRERVRQLEENEGVDNSRTPERRESAHAEVEHTEPEPTASESAPEPATETETEMEDAGDATDETETEDDDSSDGNDIIVA